MVKFCPKHEKPVSYKGRCKICQQYEIKQERQLLREHSTDYSKLGSFWTLFQHMKPMVDFLHKIRESHPKTGRKQHQLLPNKEYLITMSWEFGNDRREWFQPPYSEFHIDLNSGCAEYNDDFVTFFHQMQGELFEKLTNVGIKADQVFQYRDRYIECIRVFTLNFKDLNIVGEKYVMDIVKEESLMKEIISKIWSITEKLFPILEEYSKKYDNYLIGSAQQS